MTVGEMSILIAAVGAQVIGVITAVLTFLNGRASKIRGQEQKAAILDAKVDIMKATDGVVTKLLNEKDKTADAKVALSAVEGHAEGVANGLTEARSKDVERRLDAIEKKE